MSYPLTTYLCGACHIRIATSFCRHVYIEGGQVIMSELEWRRLTDELNRLRTLEGSLER